MAVAPQPAEAALKQLPRSGVFCYFAFFYTLLCFLSCTRLRWTDPGWGGRQGWKHWRVAGDIAGSGHLCTKQCPSLPACTHGDYNVRGQDSWRELGFCSSQCENSVSSCQPRGQSQRNLAPGLLLGSKLLYFGGLLGKTSSTFLHILTRQPCFSKAT